MDSVSFLKSLIDAQFTGQYYRWTLDRNLFSGEVYFRGAKESQTEDYDAKVVNPEGPMEQESLHVKYVSLQTIEQRIRDNQIGQILPGTLNSVIKNGYEKIPYDQLFIGASKSDGTVDENIIAFVRGMKNAFLMTKEGEERYNKKHNISNGKQEQISGESSGTSSDPITKFGSDVPFDEEVPFN